MKFYNVSKKARIAWFVVVLHDHNAMKNAKVYLRLHHSEGRFYTHYTQPKVWFEHEEDAILFALSMN